MLNVNDINKVQFTSGLSGYKKAEVDAFLDEVVKTVDTLYNENSELVRKLQVLANKIEEYRQDESNIQSAILVAQRTSEKILAEAQQQADEIIASANERGDEAIKKAQEKVLVVVNDSKVKAHEIISEAEKQSEEITAQSKEDISFLQEQYDTLKNEVADFRNNVLQLYKEHLESINRIPNERPIVKEEPIEEIEPEVIDEPIAQQAETEAAQQPVEERAAFQEMPLTVEEPGEDETFVAASEQTEPEEVTYFAQPAPVQPIEDPLTSFVQPPKKKEPFLVTIPEDEFGDVAPATTEGQLSIDLSSIKFGDDYSIDDDDDDSYNDGKSLFSRRNK